MNPWLMNALNYGQTVLRTPAAQHMTKTALNLPLVYHAATFMDDDRLSANEKMRADQFGAGDINFSDTENYIGSEMIPGNQPLGFVDEGRDFSEFDQARMGNPTQTISTPLDIDKLRDPFAPLENEFMGPHDPSVYDRYGNIQMALEDEETAAKYPRLTSFFKLLSDIGGAASKAKFSEAQLAQMQQEMEAKARAASTLDVGIAGMQKAVDTSPTKWFTTTAFRDEERRRQTTPGMTSREFFESKLPGFEERYKQSRFLRMEQQRTERKQAQEEEQKQREYDSQRRRRLRSGFGGRGRTVVTRGRA